MKKTLQWLFLSMILVGIAYLWVLPTAKVLAQLPAQIIGGCVGDTTTCRAINIDSSGNLSTAASSTTTQKTVVAGSCTQTTSGSLTVVGISTTGTVVTTTTSCAAGPLYVNNTSNATVTFRLADRAGTPVIWVGGNADFSIPANSNLSIPLNGIVFTSGLTVTAGTNAVLNMHMDVLQ